MWVIVSGIACAVWADSRTSPAGIYFSTRSLNGNWSANERIGDATFYYPDATAGPDGKIYAVWVNENSIHIRSYSGSVWSDDTVVVSGGSYIYPEIGVDSSGKIYVLWREATNTYFSYFSGGTWSVPELIATGSTWSDLTVEAGGTVHAVWTDENNLYYKAYTGGAWGPVETIATEQIQYPRIASNSSGKVGVVWTNNASDPNSPNNIKFSLKSGTSWGTSEIISSGKSFNTPVIAMDNNNKAYVLWRDSAGDSVTNGNMLLYFSSRSAEGNWSSSVRVDDGKATKIEKHPSIGFDSSGRIYVLWQATKDGARGIYFAVRQ